MVYSHVIWHWLPGPALPWTGIGAPSSSSLTMVWRRSGRLGPFSSPHCEGDQGSLAPATNLASPQTELTIDAQLRASPRPAKEADANFSVQLVSSPWTNQLWQKARKQTQLHIVAFGYASMPGLIAVIWSVWQMDEIITNRSHPSTCLLIWEHQPPQRPVDGSVHCCSPEQLQLHSL